VQWEGFRARDARLWELHGPSPATTNELEEKAGFSKEDEPLKLSTNTSLVHTFPPFSMTSIVLHAEKSGDSAELTSNAAR
jgi:hypothetical protein